ncbi:MAG: YraN family protein [Flavobacteriaceae bacterium]|nr:YraN family protein [Flavobacteriaceae bacterium]
MNNSTRGRLGEDIAVEALRKLGYRILIRNYRFGKAEVDIIAQKDSVLAFVEVKWRSNNLFGDPQNFVSKQQQKRLIAAADHYVRSNDLDINVRFDVVTILGKKQIVQSKLSKTLFFVFRCALFL